MLYNTITDIFDLNRMTKISRKLRHKYLVPKWAMTDGFVKHVCLKYRKRSGILNCQDIPTYEDLISADRMHVTQSRIEKRKAVPKEQRQSEILSSHKIKKYALAARLRRCRIMRAETLDDVAKSVGCSLQNICNLESGSQDAKSSPRLQGLADHFGCSLDWLKTGRSAVLLFCAPELYLEAERNYPKLRIGPSVTQSNPSFDINKDGLNAQQVSEIALGRKSINEFKPTAITGVPSWYEPFLLLGMFCRTKGLDVAPIQRSEYIRLGDLISPKTPKDKKKKMKYDFTVGLQTRECAIMVQRIRNCFRIPVNEPKPFP